MNSLEGNGNGVAAAPMNHSTPDQRNEDLESLKQQTEQLYKRLQEADSKVAQFQQKLQEVSQQAEAATTLAQSEQQDKQGILQQLWDVVASRDSLRGKLGNLTKQRNDLERQLNNVTQERDRLQHELKRMMENLVAANRSVESLEAEYDQDLTELANAYRAMNPAQRLALPPALKNLLDQIERDYWK